MNERQMQFRVGLFVLSSLAVGTVLIIHFGDLQQYWEKTYALAIHFDQAPGLTAGTPVRMNGLPIGAVREVVLDEQAGGVLAVVEIRENRRVRVDSQPALVRSLLGDCSIEFTPGTSPEFVPPNRKLYGRAPLDPMEIVDRLESRVSETLTAFTSTSRALEDASGEWRAVGANVNALMQTKQGDMDAVIERAALSLDQFTRTMQTANTTLASANEIIADPQLQENLRATVAALPQMVNETRETIAAARLSMQKISQNLDNLNEATDPLAKYSRSMVVKLDGSLGQLEQLITELNTFSKMLNEEDGTLKRFAADPELYENLNRSAGSMTVLLTNLEPILRDVRIFSDRVARHPELLGISGALQGSSGVKDAALEEPEQPGRQTILPAGGFGPR